VNFARSTTLFVVLGILAVAFGGSSGSSSLISFAGLFSIGLGVLLGFLSLVGVGRPADERYKAPWISLSFGCICLLIVGVSAISTVLQGKAQGIASATAPMIDESNGFRLDHPGEGWKILSQEELRKFNEEAAAGVQNGPDLGGFVFVETPEPSFRIAGREKQVGKQMIDDIDVDNKRIVFIQPDELDGHKAVRCQVVGKIAGRGIRYEVVALIANGRLYRLTALGPVDQTAEDGVAFRPFMTAFHVLPTDAQGAPHVPAIPSTPK
jgi:hypothetical protein